MELFDFERGLMNILTKALSRMMKHTQKSSHVPMSEWQGIVLSSKQLNITENPIVYRCIKLIAQNIASIPIKIECAEGLENYIAKPNNGQKLNQLLQEIITDMFIGGNAYLLKLDNIPGFYRVDPRHISDLYDEFGNGIGYAYQTHKGIKKVLRENSRCNVLNIKYVSPSGQSPCKVIEKSVRLYNSITEYNQAVMDNMASFGGALVVKGTLRDDQLQALRAEVDTKTGSHRAGHTAILYGSDDMDIKWEPMRPNVRDADYVKGQNFVAREIMQAFGIPPNLLGMSDVAYNNYEQARFFFWQDTLRPLAIYIFDELQDWLSGVFESEIKIHLDFAGVPAFADKTRELLKVIGTDCLSNDEKRQLLSMGTVV